jgi:hypothetical protein
MQRFLSAFAIVSCTVSLAVLACGGADESPAGTAGAGEAGGGAPAAGEAAAPSGMPEWSDELPADFPDDIPRFPGSKVTRARGTSDLGLSVTFLTDESIEKVANFYADAFAAKGWSTNLKAMPDSTAVFADKGRRTAATTVHQSADGTQVDIIVVTVN